MSFLFELVERLDDLVSDETLTGDALANEFLECNEEKENDDEDGEENDDENYDEDGEENEDENENEGGVEDDQNHLRVCWSSGCRNECFPFSRTTDTGQ